MRYDITNDKQQMFVVILTNAVLYFGRKSAGRRDVRFVGEVARVQHVIYGRPVLAVVEKLIMLRILSKD